MEGNFLAFVDFIGMTIDGHYRYRLDFTQAPDIVWGDDWNVTPAAISPNLQPDVNCLSYTSEIISNVKYNLAKENTCFSMQDCIDGILPLMFSSVDDDNLLILPFGLTFDETEKCLSEHNLFMENIKKINEDKDNELIDALINNLESTQGGEE